VANEASTVNESVIDIARAVKAEGGEAFLVGGSVRDRLMGVPSKDDDLEVHHLSLAALERVLKPLGEVHAVGRAFGVLKVRGVDVSVPRRDSKVGAGHRGFRIEEDPELGLREAARRRDFTINAILMDPLTGKIEDPFDGRQDIQQRKLRMVDRASFVEDPLRVMRAAQLIARFALAPDADLVTTCRSIAATLVHLPGERLWEEWRKLLLAGAVPSRGLDLLQDVEANSVLFPEISALAGCPQDPEWHPEGDVFLHTGMALDAATSLRTGVEEEDLTLMLGVLCHDLGKPRTTELLDGRWRSPGHEEAGVAPTLAFLNRLRAPAALSERVVALVRHHLAPAQFVKQGAKPKAYRRLARALSSAGTTMEMLHRLAKADHLGRTTEEASAGRFPTGEVFLAQCRELAVESKAEPDVVLGRHLIAHGLKPGRSFGRILDRCREVQYEYGLNDPEAILKRVLAEGTS
jgi:tRNA nucleotidyltransferase (CCA-adding enzyme)